MKTIKTSLVIFFLAITMAGCISIDHRVYSESPDPTHSQDYSGVYAVTPIYASNKHALASGHMLPHLKMGSQTRHGKPIDSVRIEQALNGELVFIWMTQSKEIFRVSLSEKRGWQRQEDGSFVHDPEGYGMSGQGAIGYNKHTIRVFRNATGDLVVQRSDNAGGAILIIPILIVARELSIYRRLSD